MCQFYAPLHTVLNCIPMCLLVHNFAHRVNKMETFKLYTWNGHVEHICKKLASANFAINSAKNFVPLKARKNLYYTLFDSHINFGNLLWGSAQNKLLTKIEILQQKCIRNVGLKKFRAHTEPIFKNLEILKFTDKLSFCRSVFMHQYKNDKLPISFSGIFTDIICSDNFQTRHNDYNFVNNPAVKSYLERFPYKQIVTTWNNLSIDLKATAEELEFRQMLKDMYLASYSWDTQCLGPCYSCNN